MCRAREAAQQRTCSEKVQELGLDIRKVSLYHFFHHKWLACRLLHSGDLVFVGLQEQIGNISKHMAEKSNIKAGFTGPKDIGVLRVLNMKIRWTTGGVMYESEHRRADRLVDEVELGKNQIATTLSIGESRKARKRERANTLDGRGPVPGQCPANFGNGQIGC